MQRTRMESLARIYVNKLPGNGRALREAYKYMKLAKFKATASARKRFSRRAVPDAENVYWIDPPRILMYTNVDAPTSREEAEKRLQQQTASQDFHERVFDRDRDKGKIVDGDWDRSDLRFSDLEVYKALEARINSGTEWQETPFYRTISKRICAGEVWHSCTSVADLDERCRYLDSLIDSIRCKGYRQNCDVTLPGERADARIKHPYMSAEVLVNIGRNGEYLFQDGRHRLAIAQILGIEEIPVKVLVRHKRWQDLRDHLSLMVESSAGASRRGVLYQSLMHPDLLDFTATHSCEDRFEMLQPFLENRSGAFLDVGSNLGYFCHKAEDMGFDCYAVELLPEVVWAATRIRDAEGKQFQIVEGDLMQVLDSDALKGKAFDTVNVLNILHHSLRTEEQYNALLQWLSQLSVEQMLLETHRTDEAHMVDVYANLQPEEFAQMIVDHSELTDYEFIGEVDDGRKMFRLFKSATDRKYKGDIHG
ncbi:MAG: methyltransferase domain-containing protein [Gammaproteobacteria bacterium]|nr:methyltransferase domain-containing protein [Gammaproteobacteria bacterium]